MIHSARYESDLHRRMDNPDHSRKAETCSALIGCPSGKYNNPPAHRRKKNIPLMKTLLFMSLWPFNGTPLKALMNDLDNGFIKSSYLAPQPRIRVNETREAGVFPALVFGKHDRGPLQGRCSKPQVST
jgi:hypothetical protein